MARIPSGVKRDCGVKDRAIAALCIIKTERAVFGWEAAPAPITKVLLQSAGAKIGVKITVAFPLPTAAVDIDFAR